MDSNFTIKDISFLSGYSVSTVSKALNDKKDISIETKNKIKSVVMKYKFTPNNNAVSLRRKRSKTIAIISPQINLSYYSVFISNFQYLAFKYGYRILLFQTFEKIGEFEKCLKELSDGSVDGVLVLSDEEKTVKNLSNNMLLPWEYKGISSSQSQEILRKESTNSFMILLNKLR